MYEQHFGFRKEPFSLNPDPAFLYLGRQYRLAYSLLEYGILMRSGFVVITGDVGCGKTTLIRRLISDIEDRVTLGLISNTHQRITNLMEWVSLAFGLNYNSQSPVALYESFLELLAQERASNRRVVLVIDEAQNLDVATLEEIRTLSNINSGGWQALQIILVGQPELKATLSRPELRQFLQRVATHYELKPLSEDETVDYIHHRVVHAGGQSGLFSNRACRLVHSHSRGVPRLINLLCGTALVYAFADDASHIDIAQVQAVLEDGAAGLCMNASADPASKENASNSPEERILISDIPKPILREEMIQSRQDNAAKPEPQAFSIEDAKQLFSRAIKSKS
jgi:general secretion pathway protein A